MKHTINLYTDALRSTREYLKLSNLVLLLALIIVLMVILRANSAWQASRLVTEQQRFDNQLSELRGQITAAAQQQRERQPSPQLQERIGSLQQQVSRQQSLLRDLESRMDATREGYGRLLRDLSAIHEDGLWLTRIENSRGQLVLSGQTVNSANLPRWMSRFDDVDSLRNRQFAVVALERDDARVLNFELRSQRGDMPETLAVPPGVR